MKTKLRRWQQEAHAKAMNWLVQRAEDKCFLINAAPGAGKTIASCAIAATLIEENLIDRVIVIAPRAEVVSQWSDDFRLVTGRHMAKVTAADGDIESLSLDVCATWSAIQGLLPELQAVCRSNRTLVICDEHHHAAVEAAWGRGADGAFADSKYVLILTGTPIRSDGAESVWLTYDDVGAIAHPDDGSYVLTYGEAVDSGYCRPVTFHRHKGAFTVDFGSHQVPVSSDQKADLPKELKRIPSLQGALDFYKLAKTPQFEKDGITPLETSYQSTMIEWGSQKLDDLRLRMPDAGGLVIAPNIEMAEYMAKVIERVEGERPMLVHNNMPNPGSKIKAFRNTDKRWLVSVAMVSEGVDIKRLRVLLYLPNALTELAFRQAVGRVVRNRGNEDDTRAYVVMPTFQTFDNYARRVEDEMSASARIESEKKTHKRCAACGGECDLGAAECPTCGFEFPTAPERLKPCRDCGALNPLNVDDCMSCGASFAQPFTITLEEALRTGAIVRGMDIEETDVQSGEALAPHVRDHVLRSGDQNLIRMLQKVPDESLARLRQIMGNA